MHARTSPSRSRAAERGSTLVELLVALVVLAIGVLAAARMFPAGSRSQLRDRMITTGNNYAQAKIEELTALDFSDAALSAGRHPAGSATESLGSSGAWQRFYSVEQMTAPLDNLKKVTVIVYWTVVTRDSVTATTYVRK
jgi:prepilin-type N-terminal cleavage/methylation domain-containing protein